VDEWRPQRHLGRFVVEVVVDGLDLRAMSGAYRDSGSASCYPAKLLSLLVYGYATAEFLSRKLECKFACNSGPLRGSFASKPDPPLALRQYPFPLAFGDGEGRLGMIGMDLIGGIHRVYFEQRLPIKEIVRTLAVSRATVRRGIRSEKTGFKYQRGVQPAPKLGEWVTVLIEMLEREAKLPRRERRSTQRLFEELRGRGYGGAHDRVHRFVKAWRPERARVPEQAFAPMSFAPGEAYQFDWSHETITLRGLPLTIKAAQMKLPHSRMPFVRAYLRETQEPVFDAHDKAFVFYSGVCRRGIYDNMKMAVEAIFVGKARQYNRRILQMCLHHLIDPVACTPASGWEKGQVENQVGNLRDQLFRPKPRVKGPAERNAGLADQCIAYACRTQPPEFKDRTIWEVFQDERAV
jgi:transposase